MNTVSKIAPTVAEAVAATPEQLTDTETVFAVQRALLALGYVDGGPPDGKLSQKTIDQILAFRARNNLQLVPTIDQQLLQCLKVAQPKVLPIEQVTATKAEVAPQVTVVAQADKIEKVAWWAKIWSIGAAAVSAFGTFLNLLVDNLDEATGAIQPVRTLFSDFGTVPAWVWLVGIVIVASLFAWQASIIRKQAGQLADAGVEGYQRGTIKNDLPPKEEA